MRIEDLNYFLAVAETGHVGRASERLGQSQPALTKGIQRLERELQLQLFERTSKGMELTMPGRAFFERARHVRASLDDAVKEANDLHLGRVGVLRVGVAPSYSELFFGSVIPELLRQRPAARVKVTIGLNDRLLAALQFGDLDLGFSALQAEMADFDQMPLFQDDLHVVVREGHPLLEQRELRLEDLADAGWVLPARSVSARRSMEARMAARGLPNPNVVVESDSSITTMAGVVRATDLLTVLSESLLDKPVGAGLRSLGLADTVWPRQVGITTRRGGYLSPLAQRLIEMLQARFAGGARH